MSGVEEYMYSLRMGHPGILSHSLRILMYIHNMRMHTHAAAIIILL
jgi:hypothetical protein